MTNSYFLLLKNVNFYSYIMTLTHFLPEPILSLQTIPKKIQFVENKLFFELKNVTVLNISWG